MRLVLGAAAFLVLNAPLAVRAQDVDTSADAAAAPDAPPSAPAPAEDAQEPSAPEPAPPPDEPASPDAALTAEAPPAEAPPAEASVAEVPSAAPADPAPVEVTVRAQPSEAQRLQDSAEAVNVVDTRRARQETADLGEVLARTQGIGVRRSGGLGSAADVALNGLQGDQVRFFLDGVPLEYAGYPFGVVNIPISLVERVEVYRGVVPIRFGADALGGAVNVVTDQSYETHVGVSYQLGSFGNHRATINGRYRHEPTGFIAGGASFVDIAKNDYGMDDRELATPDGGTVVRTLPRFHDRYRAAGASLELGFVDQPWARRLLVQPFFSTFYKELQHNAVMSVPYGEVNYGQDVYGVTARYEVDLHPEWELELLANYAYRRLDFEDLSTTVYKWTGERGRAVGRNDARGEIRGEAIDESIYEHSWYGRVGVGWQPSPIHTLRASITPELVRRVGDDHVQGRVDLLGLHDERLQLVGGVEYELNLLEERLSNIVFVKGYYMRASHEHRPEGVSNPIILELETDRKNWGGGDAVRFRFTPWLLAKVSYEYATRLPTALELFGNGVLVESNASLKPEQSHNVNVGPRLELSRTPAGTFIVDINGFLRDTTDQIILLAGKQFTPYANLSDMRGVGVENAISWASPRRYVGLDGSFTWQDLRNTSTTGPFAPFEGMRIPSRPYMFASWGVHLRSPEKYGVWEPFYYGRWVHGFDRGWAIGAPEFKISLPAQVNHDVGITYSLSRGFGKVACTFEIDNVADAQLYDQFGVQRPGRSLNLKLLAQL